MADSPIKIANEIMTIDEACIAIGMGDVSGMAKAYCPFGPVFHSDGGRERAFKIYPQTNSAYCFACQRRYDPVSLVATEQDISYVAAAEWILEEKKWVAPDYESQWDALTTRPTPVDYEGLQAALKLACGRMVTDWETRQFEPQVAHKLTLCLGMVRKVTNDDEAKKWFDTTKKAMSQVLATTNPTS